MANKNKRHFSFSLSHSVFLVQKKIIRDSYNEFCTKGYWFFVYVTWFYVLEPMRPKISSTRNQNYCQCCVANHRRPSRRPIESKRIVIPFGSIDLFNVVFTERQFRPPPTPENRMEDNAAIYTQPKSRNRIKKCRLNCHELLDNKWHCTILSVAADCFCADGIMSDSHKISEASIPP